MLDSKSLLNMAANFQAFNPFGPRDRMEAAVVAIERSVERHTNNYEFCQKKNESLPEWQQMAYTKEELVLSVHFFPPSSLLA